MKTRPYIIATLIHGCSSKFEKHVADVDAKGNFNFHFKNINVESARLRLKVHIHRKLLSDKQVGDVNVLVSDLILAGGKPSLAKYELGKGPRKGKNVYLKLSYKLSSHVTYVPADVSSHRKSELESKRLGPAIGNDIALLASFQVFVLLWFL
ncbi:hypothetical protein RND81_13G143700 [Saponaria officinalis]|uniref:Uncharacterized protein n=1 Tax=Saponaria officinalis TaxID=3572 RepID=A0AAW1H0M3_SAPOF